MRIIFKYCFVVFYVILLPCNHIHANKRAVENYSKDSIQISKYIEEVKKIKTTNIQDKKLTDKMLALLNKASILSQNINNWQLQFKINSLYADVYSKNNNTSIAMSYQFKNLGLLETEYKIKKDTSVEKYLADTYLSIGYNYLFLENYQKSKNYYDRTTRFLQSSLIKDYPEIYNTRMIVLYNNIAAMHTMTHDNKSAAKYYKKALEVILNEDSSKHEIKNYEASVYNNLGIIAQNNDDQSGAFEYYKKANKLWEVGKDTANLARVYNNIGIYYLKVNKSQTAIDFFKKAYLFSKISKNIKSEIIAAQCLTEVYSTFADYKSALYYNKIETTLRDSLMSVDKIRSVTQLELQYQHETQRKEEEIQKKIDKEKNQKRIILFSAMITILIFVLILFILLYRNQQIKNREIALQDENLKLEKQQLKSDIEFKNKELTTNVMYLLNKNELISSILEKLLTLQPNSDTEEDKTLKSVISELKYNINNNSWNEFELRFQSVHQEFHDKLNKLHPNLTPNELKLCSFLKLNMSTKDISSVTLQSTKSIEVARTRLRKKLELERDENLIAYLQRI